MKKIMVEFPVIGYAEVEIEVEDDMDSNDILDAIRADEIEVSYDGRSTVEGLIPLMHIRDYANSEGYMPFAMQVVE